jgi:hypothetical protein
VTDACSVLDALLEEGPVPEDILDRLEAWSNDDAEPGVAVEICVNGERYHATSAMLAIMVDLILYRTLGHYAQAGPRGR